MCGFKVIIVNNFARDAAIVMRIEYIHANIHSYTYVQCLSPTLHQHILTISEVQLFYGSASGSHVVEPREPLEPLVMIL